MALEVSRCLFVFRCLHLRSETIVPNLASSNNLQSARLTCPRVDNQYSRGSDISDYAQ